MNVIFILKRKKINVGLPDDLEEQLSSSTEQRLGSFVSNERRKRISSYKVCNHLF